MISKASAAAFAVVMAITAVVLLLWAAGTALTQHQDEIHKRNQAVIAEFAERYAQEQAAKNGAGHWVVGPEGKPKFEWLTKPTEDK